MNFRRNNKGNEESGRPGDFLEDHMNQCKTYTNLLSIIETLDKINVLRQSAASIKRTTMNIK